jgi:hypothetical protein
VINKWRKSLDLEDVDMFDGPMLAQTLKIPFTYCWSPALVPKPTDWPSHIGQASVQQQIYLDPGPLMIVQMFVDSSFANPLATIRLLSLCSFSLLVPHQSTLDLAVSCSRIRPKW